MEKDFSFQQMGEPEKPHPNYAFNSKNSRLHEESFKDVLQGYHQQVESAIGQIVLPKYPQLLYEPMRYSLKTPAKRIRPILALMVADLFDYPLAKAMPAALAVEVFHNFTLVHDDISDKADLRRGQATVHKKWDLNTAIFVGDALLIFSYQLLNQVDRDLIFPCFKLINKTALELVEGQMLDLAFETRDQVAIPDYLEMIKLKTSSLLAASLKIGAILARSSEADQKALYDFGLNLGLSFQIHDDILDCFGEELKTGKKVGGDIVANKKTYLLLKAFELSDAETLKKLKHLLTLDGAKFSAKKIAGTLEIFQQLGIKNLAEQARDRHFESALTCLHVLSVSPSKKRNLKKVANFLLNREH